MPSDTDAGSWNETRVGKTWSPGSHTDQTEHHATACRELLQRAENDATFLPSIITGDKSWVYGYDPETKQISSQLKTPLSPRPKKARQVRSNVKTMLIAFFDAEGLVYHEFLPQRQTMNQTVYITVLQLLLEAVRRKRPHRWSSGTWLLHHDNAPYHAALSVREFFCRAQHLRGSPPALLTRFGPLRLLPLPQAEERPQVETISRRRGDTIKHDTAVAGHSQTSLPDIHWKVEGLLESLHTIWRVVLWRR
jgi:hypothetical protein